MSNEPGSIKHTNTFKVCQPLAHTVLEKYMHVKKPNVTSASSYPSMVKSEDLITGYYGQSHLFCFKFK